MEEKITVSPSHAPPWFFFSNINYSGLEPGPIQGWKPEPMPSGEEIKRFFELAQEPVDLKYTNYEINIELKSESESHKKFRQRIKEYQKKKNEQKNKQPLSRNSISKKNKRNLKKPIKVKGAVASGVDSQISDIESSLRNMKV